MDKFWILIFVLFFATNSFDKAESVDLFDEIFGEGWWDNDKDEEWNKLTLEQNVHQQIDRQNTQIGQIEPNSTDQNPPLTEADHFDKAKIGEQINSNENIAEDARKRKIIDKFQAIKDAFKQKGKYSKKEWVQIDNRIAKHLKVYRTKIFEWKKEFGLSQNKTKNERINLIEKFDQKKAELTRGGFKNSYYHKIDETVAKELGLSVRTIYRWKNELGQSSNTKQKELVKLYYEIKGQNPKISDEKIAKMLKIGGSTLHRWKKQFKRQQLHPNSVDGHSVEENAAANVQEIGNSNSE